MSVYKIPIEVAFLIFPLLAFLFTIPYLIYQYRKYGSIPILRSIIIYSFILYLLCAYFLVILPLPDIDTVKNLTTPTTQLIPFQFVKDIINVIDINFNSISSYPEVINTQVFYVAVFNIILTIPFGIYLRYYFECRWYKILLYGFFLSLFFELTQLSGLYGIYPRPYRLFDVDDLILNTMGAFIGYLITPVIVCFLPSRKKLDEKSFENGKKVTLFRRALGFCIDFFFFIIIVVGTKIATYNTDFSKYATLISFIICYILTPLFTNGKTFGKMILKLQATAKVASNTSRLKVIARYILGYLLFYYQFVIINILEQIPKGRFTPIVNSSIILLKVYFLLNIISILISLVKKKKEFLYEKISKTEIVSTIEYEPTIESEKTEIKKQEEENDVRTKKDNEKL